MQPIFSADRYRARDRFRAWRDVSHAIGWPGDIRRAGAEPFEGRLELAEIGGLGVLRGSFGAHSRTGSAQAVRSHGRHDKLAAVFHRAGTARGNQFDRTAVHGTGDIAILDPNAPFDLEIVGRSDALMVEIPRERLESVLGPARLYASLRLGGERPGAALANAFFDELVRVHADLTPATAERMASIGVDLLVASVTERMAVEMPRPLQGTVLVQRAKAHVEANLAAPTLDPPHLAAAMGVSLRRLQQLFHERGRHISGWIWQRRLETAAQRLADPGQLHLSIGTIAYGCGFANQAHFSKRFRDRFGVSPRDYRQAALMPGGHAG